MATLCGRLLLFVAVVAACLVFLGFRRRNDAFATVLEVRSFHLDDVEASCSAHGLGVRSRPALVFDAFLFHYEDDLLSLRVEELGRLVDVFVLFESGQTFSTGEAKPSRWKEIKPTVPGKMRHVVLPMVDGERTPFFREGDSVWFCACFSSVRVRPGYARNRMWEPLFQIMQEVTERSEPPEVLYFMGDADEVPLFALWCEGSLLLIASCRSDPISLDCGPAQVLRVALVGRCSSSGVAKLSLPLPLATSFH
jgi:hypothetical protein